MKKWDKLGIIVSVASFLGAFGITFSHNNYLMNSPGPAVSAPPPSNVTTATNWTLTTVKAPVDNSDEGTNFDFEHIYNVSLDDIFVDKTTKPSDSILAVLMSETAGKPNGATAAMISNIKSPEAIPIHLHIGPVLPINDTSFTYIIEEASNKSALEMDKARFLQLNYTNGKDLATIGNDVSVCKLTTASNIYFPFRNTSTFVPELSGDQNYTQSDHFERSLNKCGIDGRYLVTWSITPSD